MRGDRSGIRAWQFAEAAQHGVGRQGYQGTRCHHRQCGQGDIEQRIARQFDSAFQADGEQQKDAQQFVADVGDLEVGAHEAGDHAEQEEQDDGFEVRHLQRRTRARINARS